MNEAFRVLRYDGKMIISESKERYEIIKSHIEELGYRIKIENYKDTNRWFYLHITNDKIDKIELEIEKELEDNISTGRNVRKNKNILVEN